MTGKKEYAPSVTMTETEYNKLMTDFGASNVERFVDKLSNAKGAHGYKYKSDYRAILSWVVESETGQCPIDLRKARNKK